MINTRPVPRLGFLGLGWIGRNRLEMLAKAGFKVAAVFDTSPLFYHSEFNPSTIIANSYEELLYHCEIDGVVIATPSALHAEQCIGALDAKHAVFCQKPLGVNASEVAQVMESAHRNDRLLGVDYSYRYLEGMQLIQGIINANEIGDLYAIDLTFHNAYGPEKAWFYNSRLSGGGCMMDLGVHLIDLALWIQDYPSVAKVTSRLFANGKTINERADQVEDYATARIDFENGVSAQLQCSWKQSLGEDCRIEFCFYGTKGGLSLKNVNGSFYDFITMKLSGTQKWIISKPPEEWGGSASIEWARRLQESRHFRLSANNFIKVYEVLDAIYAENTGVTIA